MFESSTIGELPPPPPRACFGREDLVKKIVSLAESLTPTALIGVGGIGKTSVSLAVLHHNHVKKRFGDNRRFVRCDQFPASCPHFLTRLSEVIGAGVKNPETLTPLRPTLSSKEMIIVLDNAESILDPQGANGREIYGVVEELSRFPNICLLITSRITTIPLNCEAIEIPTLSTEAAHDTFYHIYKYGRRSDSVDDILKRLDFHPLSVTLLAAVAHQNQWNNDRLAREWEQRRTGVLETEHQSSLATTIELSLASPLFKALGPDARGLLGVLAFYPQGVSENNLDWLFPTIPNVTRILDRFCILSLTYRSNGFTTMLAPLRDHLRPKDPRLSPLLCTTKERYFTRMAVVLDPNKPAFRETLWIVSEDVNVEHLIDVFTSLDPDSTEVWDACIKFMRHLAWHKPRQIVLRPKFEALSDTHPSKPECLFEAAELIGTAGNYTEKTRLLQHVLKLERERGDESRVAFTLYSLSISNPVLGLYEEGIRRAKEGSEIYERLGKPIGHARCLQQLAKSLWASGQLDAAEEAAVQSSKLLPEKGQETEVCQSHRILGDIYRSRGQTEKAIHHFEVALGIASPSNLQLELLWTHFSLARVFLVKRQFDDAHTHIKQAKLHAPDNPYFLGRVASLHAELLYQQRRLEEAKFEVLGALEIFEQVGATTEIGLSQRLLRMIEQAAKDGS
jgi:tetratricopeptide (TPR) repeat protein